METRAATTEAMSRRRRAAPTAAGVSTSAATTDSASRQNTCVMEVLLIVTTAVTRVPTVVVSELMLLEGDSGRQFNSIRKGPKKGPSSCVCSLLLYFVFLLSQIWFTSQFLKSVILGIVL